MDDPEAAMMRGLYDEHAAALWRYALRLTGDQARAATLQIVMIGVALCVILLLRPRGILGELRVVSRHLNPRRGGRVDTTSKEPDAERT